MKIKNILTSTLLVGIMVLLCGCDKMIPLSEDDENRVAIYAAGVISKFNRYQNRGVVPVNMAEAFAKEEEKSEAAGGNGQEVTYDEEGNIILDDGTVVAPGENLPGPASSGEPSSLTDVIAIPGASFTYRQTVVNNTYGNTDYFIYEPNPGHSFVTSVFKVTNTTGQDVVCNIQDQALSFTATLSGHSASVYRTAFGDDLTTYNATLKPGESKDLTVLFQFPTGITADLSSIQLTVIKNDVRYPVSF